MSGNVLVDDVPVDKVGSKVPVNAAIRIRGSQSKFVGRGGDKIEAAFEHFSIALEAIVAIDVGASTGGFTDCMLQRGAAKVYAVDVGYNQLDTRLRNDPRVVVLEKTHAGQMLPEHFLPRPTFATIDVSFIGLRKVLEPVANVLEENAAIIALVKPQFELGPEHVGKGGVVKEETLHQKAIALVESAAIQIGLETCGSMPSPLRGEKKGNQEYFLHLKKGRRVQ